MSAPTIVASEAEVAAVKHGPTLTQRLTLFMPVIALVVLLAALSIADPTSSPSAASPRSCGPRPR